MSGVLPRRMAWCWFPTLDGTSGKRLKWCCTAWLDAKRWGIRRWRGHSEDQSRQSGHEKDIHTPTVHNWWTKGELLRCAAEACRGHTFRACPVLSDLGRPCRIAEPWQVNNPVSKYQLLSGLCLTESCLEHRTTLSISIVFFIRNSQS